MVSVKVLGTGCARCEKLEAAAYQATSGLGFDVSVEKVTDVSQIMRYGILSTPGLVINEEIKSAGRLPTVEEIRNWVTEAAGAAQS